MQYADDVAKLFIRATEVEFEGAEVFNLESNIVTMQDIVDTIEKLLPESRGQITFDDQALPFPIGFDGSMLRQSLQAPAPLSLEAGIAQSIDFFRDAVAAGKLSLKDIEA